MTEKEFIAKWIGAKIISGQGASGKDHSGQVVVGVLIWGQAKKIFELGLEPSRFYFIVSAPENDPGFYDAKSFPSSEWVKLPKSFDWSGRLDELSNSTVEVEPNTFSEASPMQSSGDIYAVGPSGETQGFLDGNTGLSFL